MKVKVGWNNEPRKQKPHKKPVIMRSSYIISNWYDERKVGGLALNEADKNYCTSENFWRKTQISKK
jgi:hypothetical protein